MAAPRMMYEAALDELKGWPSPHAVDFVARLSASVPASARPVYGGRVVHLNNSKEFELGAKGTQVAIFLLQGEEDLDVSNPGGENWTAIAPAGWMSGLVSTGAYELQTTEYDTTIGVTYNPNDILHAPTEDQITGTDKSAAGRLYKLKNWPGGGGGGLTLYTDNACAVVSRGALINHHRRKVVTFWPVYLPGTA